MPFSSDYGGPAGIRVPTPEPAPERNAYPTETIAAAVGGSVAATVERAAAPKTKFDYAMQGVPVVGPLIEYARRLSADQYGQYDSEHNPLDFVRGTYYEGYLHRFVASRNSEETRAIMGRIDTERAERKVMAASGPFGVVAGLGAGLLDPTMALIPGAIIRSVAGGYSVAQSALSLGKWATAQATASEAIMQTYSPTRTLGESATNIATSAIFGALLGAGTAKLLTKVERARFDSDFTKVRAELELHQNEYRTYTGPDPNAGLAKDLAVIRTEKASINRQAAEAEGRGDIAGRDTLFGRAEALSVKERDAEAALQKADGGVRHRDDPQISKDTALEVLENERVRLDAEAFDARQRGDTKAAEEFTWQARSANSAATDVRNLDMVSFGLDKVPYLKEFLESWSPARRTMAAEAVAARRNFADLAELPYRFVDNKSGVSTTSMGGPAIDRLAHMQITGTRWKLSEFAHEQFAQYRFGDPEKRGPALRASVERLAGRDQGKMTMGEWWKEVGVALQSKDQHAIPEVAATAKFIREHVFDPWKERAKVLAERDTPGFEHFKELDPETFDSYFTRVYNRRAIMANKPAVVDRVANWLGQNQAAKAEIQQRLELSAAQLRSWEQQINRLEARRQTLEGHSRDLMARLDERAMEVARAERRTGALDERAALLSDEAAQLDGFIKMMREEVRDPALLARVDALEKDAALLRKADKPMTEVQLRAREDEEAKGILTGTDRMAAEILTGRRAPPEVPGFLKWIENQGGLRDTEGHVAPMLDDPKLRKRLIAETKAEADARHGAGQGQFDVGTVYSRGGKGMTLDQLAQAIQEEARGHFPALDVPGGGKPSRDEVLAMISDATHGKEPPWMAERLNERQRQMLQAKETAAALDEMFTRAGVEVKSVRDVADVLKGNGRVTLADLDKIAADMEAAGQSVPISVQRAGAEEKVFVARETLSNLRAMIERAKVAAASKEKSGRIASERGAEASMAERANRGRLGILEDRLARSDLKDELLNEATAIAAKERDAVRGKIEADLGSWQGTSASEAKSALRAREKAMVGRDPNAPRLTSADSAVDSTVKRIVESERNLGHGELRGRAEEIINRIIGSPDGRLPYDIHNGGPEIGPPGGGPAPRGPMAARDFAIPDSMLRGIAPGVDAIEMNAELVSRTYLRTMVPDILIAERFGDVRMTNAFKEIDNAYDALIRASPERSLALEKERLAVHRDLAAVRDRIRNVYGWAPDLRNAARIVTGVKAFNNLTSMGVATITSLPDVAGTVFRHGIEATMSDGWIPFFTMLRDPALFEKFKDQWRAVGIGTDTLLNSRQRGIDDITEMYRPETKFERGLQAASDKFFLANLLAPWTDAAKNIAANVTVAEILKAAEAIVKGKATKEQVTKLGEASITPEMAGRIWDHWQRHGETIDRVRLPNTKDWGDQAAARALEGAVAREADIAVITPGQEKPLFISHPVYSVLGQYLSFTAAAGERLMIANLQRSDIHTMHGLIAALGLGMLSYRLNALFSGQPVSDRPQDWFKEAVSKANLVGWFEQGNALAAKASGGQLDMWRLIGADKPLSRFASRSALDMFLGPTAGKLESVLKITHGAATGNWNEHDTHAMRQLTISQNLFYLRRGWNEVEAGLNSAFHIPMKAPAQ